MASRDASRNQFHAGVKLSRTALVAVKAQRRIAADLAQLCKLCQHLNALGSVGIAAHLLQFFL